MPIKGFDNFIGKPFDFRPLSFGVKVNSAVWEVLNVPRNIESAGQSEHLGSETDPLDMSSIPDIAMGDMG